eukprot:g8214.t1
MPRGLFRADPRISHVRRYSRSSVDTGRSPITSRPLIKRPSTRRQNPLPDENGEALIQKTQFVLRSESVLDPVRTKELLTEVEESLNKMQSLSIEEIVSIAGLLGTLLMKSHLKSSDPSLAPLVQELSTQIHDQIQIFQISDLCLFVWFYGCFGPSILNSSSSSFNGVSRVIAVLMKRIESLGVNTVKDSLRLFWGIERMKFKGHTRVTYNTTQRVITDVHKSSAAGLSDVASLVLLASKLRVLDGMEFLRRTSRCVKNRFPEFSDEALRDFVTGFAIYEFHKLPSVFDVFCEEVARRKSVMKLPVFIQILHSLSRIRYLPDEEIINGLAERILAHEGLLAPKEVTRCAQALTSSENYSSSQIVCILASCSILDKLNEEQLINGLNILSSKLTSQMSQASCVYLHQVLVHAKAVLNVNIDEQLVSQECREVCAEQWIYEQNRSSSKNASSLVSAADGLGLELLEELSPISRMPILYIQSNKSDKKVVLDLIHSQMDRYINQEQSTIVPWKLWQQRILEREGYKVISIFEESWNQVPEHKRVRHLARKLDLWTQEEIEEIEISLGLIQTQKEE